MYEDVHWADPTSLELLDLLIDRVQGAPMLVLITFRPEFEPSWIALCPCHRADPQPVEPPAGCGHGRAAERRQERCLPRCSTRSSPRRTACLLFVEELTRTVLETNLLRG